MNIYLVKRTDAEYINQYNSCVIIEPDKTMAIAVASYFMGCKKDVCKGEYIGEAPSTSVRGIILGSRNAG